MLAVLALVFVVVPIVELYVIVQVGQAVGVLETIGLLIVMGVVGGWLVKREGVGVWRRAQLQLRNGRPPARELVDGVLVLLAGALMLAPGFLSDVAGILLLLPPVRAVVRPALVARLVPMDLGGGGQGTGRQRATARVTRVRRRPPAG